MKQLRAQKGGKSQAKRQENPHHQGKYVGKRARKKFLVIPGHNNDKYVDLVEIQYKKESDRIK